MNFKSFSRSLKQFFLTVGQNNLVTKYRKYQSLNLFYLQKKILNEYSITPIVYVSEILTQNSIKCGNIHARRTNGIEIELCNFIFLNRTKIIFSRAKVPKKDKQSEHAAHDSAKMIFHSINYFFNAFHFTSQNYFLEFSDKNW